MDWALAKCLRFKLLWNFINFIVTLFRYVYKNHRIFYKFSYTLCSYWASYGHRSIWNCDKVKLLDILILAMTAMFRRPSWPSDTLSDCERDGSGIDPQSGECPLRKRSATLNLETCDTSKIGQCVGSGTTYPLKYLTLYYILI